MSNLEALIEGKIIPKDYARLSAEEMSAIEELTSEEVAAIISASRKLHASNPRFTQEHAEHCWFY